MHSYKYEMKTYTRKRVLFDDYREPKRRRVESDRNEDDDLPGTRPISVLGSNSADELTFSSPQRDVVVFSDDKQRDQTPPSSPPTKSPPRRAAKLQPLFSFLRRKKINIGSEKAPLCEKSINIQSTVLREKKTRLTQTQIDLGGNVQTTCKTCRMEYTASSEEDVSLHKKFHAMNTGGVDLSKAILENLKRNRIWSDGSGSWIASVCGSDSSQVRDKASRILRVVNTELLAVEIKDDELWEGWPATRTVSRKMEHKWAKKGNLRVPSALNGKIGRYKVYLYVSGHKCVGLCLAERVSKAKRVLPREDEDESTRQSQAQWGGSILVGRDVESAKVGISRIWTSKSHRRRGVARALLDCAAENYLYGIKIPRTLVAFSQPTESGARLARKWFGAESGWLVYVDHDPD